MEGPEDKCYCVSCGEKIQDSFHIKVLQDTWHNACFQYEEVHLWLHSMLKIEVDGLQQQKTTLGATPDS